MTGGLVASRITAIPGASDVFRGGVVSYASEVKFDLLEVSPGPVVNEPAAIEMAEGVQRLLEADIGLSLTGVAGPAEQDEVPVGTVCIAVALPTGSHAVPCASARCASRSASSPSSTASTSSAAASSSAPRSSVRRRQRPSHPQGRRGPTLSPTNDCDRWTAAA